MIPLPILAAPTFLDHLSAELDAGGGVQGSTTDSTQAAPSGEARIGLTFGELQGVGFHLAVRGRLDTTGYGQIGAGAGFAYRRGEISPFELRVLLLGGVTEIPLLGSPYVPMAGGEIAMAKSFGERRLFELSSTVGAAAFFPGTSADTVDQATATATSYRAGVTGWWRMAFTFYLHRDFGFGLGPFVGASFASARRDVLSPTVAEDSRPTDLRLVGGLQLVFAK